MHSEQIDHATGHETNFGSRKVKFYLCGTLSLSLLTAIFVLFLNTSILGCSAHGYDAETYLGDCSKTTFGEYERGALFFNLQPKAVASLKSSEVVYFGWSHGLVGLSTKATENYFENKSIRFFNAGFSGEFSSFYDLLIPQLELKHKVVIIDGQRFFASVTSKPSALIKENPWRAHMQYAIKHAWQRMHRWACREHPAAVTSWCGQSFASFRNSSDGRAFIDYSMVYGNPLPRYPVARGTTFDPGMAKDHIATGKAFIERHRLDASCIVLISPPNSLLASEALVSAIADGIGATFVDVNIPNLSTVDGGHLNAKDAETWSAAFWRAADATIQRCVASAH